MIYTIKNHDYTGGPYWHPLERFLAIHGRALARPEHFMWMNATHVESVDTIVKTTFQAYKNTATRRYLILDSTGTPYGEVSRPPSTPGSCGAAAYAEADPVKALARVLNMSPEEIALAA